MTISTCKKCGAGKTKTVEKGDYFISTKSQTKERIFVRGVLEKDGKKYAILSSSPVSFQDAHLWQEDHIKELLNDGVKLGKPTKIDLSGVDMRAVNWLSNDLAKRGLAGVAEIG